MRAEIAANTSFGPRPPNSRLKPQPQTLQTPPHTSKNQNASEKRSTAKPQPLRSWPVTASKKFCNLPIRRCLFKEASLARSAPDRLQNVTPVLAPPTPAIHQPKWRLASRIPESPQNPTIPTPHPRPTSTVRRHHAPPVHREMEDPTAHSPYSGTADRHSGTADPPHPSSPHPRALFDRCSRKTL